MSSNDNEDEQADDQGVGAADAETQEAKTAGENRNRMINMNVVSMVSMDGCGCYRYIIFLDS